MEPDENIWFSAGIWCRLPGKGNWSDIKGGGDSGDDSDDDDMRFLLLDHLGRSKADEKVSILEKSIVDQLLFFSGILPHMACYFDDLFACLYPFFISFFFRKWSDN